jgi:uncharacterized repeat protein (TIGR01451 family)
VEFTPWSALTWHGTNLVVTNIVGSVTNVFTNCTVRVRSSNNQQQWSGWERAENGYPLSATPSGQWLEIEVTLQQLSPDVSPVLYDIAVTPIPQGVADLEVSQSWSAAYAWWPLTNRITVINHGPDDASGLVLTGSLPVGLTFLSAASTQGSLVQSNGLLRWNLGSLPNGASLQAEAVVVATNTGTFTNFVVVKAYDTDPQTNNNQAVAAMTVYQAPCLAPPTGLLSWWPGESNALDIVGSHDGTAVNGVTFVSGKVGQAFNLDGVNDYVDLGNWFNLQVFSISLWLKPRPSQMQYADIMDNNHTGSRSWVVQSQNTSAGNATYWGSGFNSTSGGAGVGFWLTNDVWQMLTITLDSNRTHRLFVDGRLVGTSTLPGPIYYDGSQHLNIGRHQLLGRYFNGQLDEACIFSRALSELEVVGLYLAGSTGMCKSPVDVRLTIAPTPSGVVLRWPSTAAGWQLQYVEALFPGVLWQNESTPPQLINSAYQLTLPFTTTQRFYRLKAP